MKIVLSYIVLLAAALPAQEFVSHGAPPAAAMPAFEASAGYSYFALDTPEQHRVGLSGVNANGFVDFTARWGLTVDANYARSGQVYGTGHSGNVGSLLTGPVFYPVSYGNTRVFLHTMGGVGLVNSAVPVAGSRYLDGSVMRFSYVFGAGFEYSLAGPFAMRFGGDYQRTTFADPQSALRFQNNIRIVTGFTYRFGRLGKP